jgi:MscS family membrane protein
MTPNAPVSFRSSPGAALAAALLVVMAVAPAAAAVDWTGAWDTSWSGGHAVLLLNHEGSRVTGSYQPGGGAIEGEVIGLELKGRWRDGDRSGAFVIDMSGDGGTFFGHFEGGDWWSGSRLAADAAATTFAADRSSPRAVLRSFLVAGNAIRAGQHAYFRQALECLVLGDDRQLDLGTRSGDVPVLFFEVLDRCTIPLGDIPDVGDTNAVEITLYQAGSNATTTLAARRDAGGWRLVVPGEAKLRADLGRFLAARGHVQVNPLGHLALDNPRSTMRVFLEEFANWDNGGRERVRRTLDLGGINEPLREAMLPLLATYLKQTIDRVGLVVWQEIPDDPGRTIPYVHFRHPRGAIVIAPVEQDSVRSWKFTARTLDDVRMLYETLEDVPLASEMIPRGGHAAYFRLNQAVRAKAPQLTRLVAGLELWQWAAIVVSLLAAFVVALVIDGLVRLTIGHALRDRDAEVRLRLRRHLLGPVAITLAVAAGYVCMTSIGLPLTLFPVLHGLAVLAIGLGLTWTLYNALGLLQEFMHERARQTISYYDELLVTLLGSLGKAVAVILGVVFLAREIGIPVSGVVAGLGVGGFALAIAARDTLANLFGSVVILADRPFARGDLVVVAGNEGYIQSVGLRSTTLRTREDSLVAIPNSLLANEVIDNLGRRRQRRIKSRLGVRYDTPPEKLESLARAVLQVMQDQPQVRPLYMSSGVWELGESSIDLEFSCYIDADTHGTEREIRHELFLAIVRAAADLGVEFAFPTRTVHIESAADPAEDMKKGGGS